MAEKDVVDVQKLFLLVGSGTMLTIATVFAVEALYHWGEQVDFAHKNDAAPPRELTAIREAGHAQISKYDVADKAKNTYVIPIDSAEKFVIQEAKSR